MDGQLKYYDQRVQKKVRILANNNDRAVYASNNDRAVYASSILFQRNNSEFRGENKQ